MLEEWALDEQKICWMVEIPRKCWSQWLSFNGIGVTLFCQASHSLFKPCSRPRRSRATPSPSSQSLDHKSLQDRDQLLYSPIFSLHLNCREHRPTLWQGSASSPLVTEIQLPRLEKVCGNFYHLALQVGGHQPPLPPLSPERREKSLPY